MLKIKKNVNERVNKTIKLLYLSFGSIEETKGKVVIVHLFRSSSRSTFKQMIETDNKEEKGKLIEENTPNPSKQEMYNRKTTSVDQGRLNLIRKVFKAGYRSQ